MDYSRKVVIVTGTSSGIGRETALAFARRQARLVVSARRGPLLEALASECRGCGAEVEAMVGDLAERSFAESMVTRAMERFGRVDILVNNAGISMHKQIYDMTAEDVETTIQVNFMAAAYLTLAVIPPMLRQEEGYIVNISSSAGRVPPPRESVYAASKYAMTGFSEGLALDLEGSNIHSAVLHVGPIDTEIWEKSELPSAYRGKKFPPSLVTDAVFKCIEKRRHEITVPRLMGLPVFFKLFLPGLYRWGCARFEPVPAEVVEDARAKAAR